MSLFVCKTCGCVDNTALRGAWPSLEKPVDCTECHTGKWHGCFTKARPDSGSVLCNDAYLYGPGFEKTEDFAFRAKYQGLTVVKIMQPESGSVLCNDGFTYWPGYDRTEDFKTRAKREGLAVVKTF